MVMDFTKKTLDIHNQGTGERLAGVTLEDTETCELHLLIDQEVIEFFTTGEPPTEPSRQRKMSWVETSCQIRDSGG